MVFRRIPHVAVAALALSMLAIAAQAQSSAPASCYPPLSLVTTSLPQTTAGASFNATLAATGGQPPYAFSGTALPQGLSINSAGDLSGTAPSAGTYSVNVAVTDSLKNTVSAQLALSVLAASSTPPSNPPPSSSTKPAISSLTATPSTITAGQHSSLTWKVSGQTKLTLNGVAGVASPAVESPDATTTYTLLASNSAGSVSKSVTVTVNPATPPAQPPPLPVITSLTATPSTITAGQSSSLTWKVSGQTKLALNGIAGVTSPAVESPDGTTTYTLQASNSAGSVSKSVRVTVNPVTPPPPPPPGLPVIASLTAAPSTITAGQISSLMWKVTGETTLTLNGVSGAASPSVESPTGTTLYTLQASNSAGTVSKSVTVTVNPVTPPPPPSGPPTGTALTACTDLTKSGSYHLANNVSSAGTCFGVDANNITLDLNGYTITYGTGGGSSPTPAIEAHDCWWTASSEYEGGPCSSLHNGLEVYGGNIVQSANSAPFSDVFSFGQGTFSSAPYIHDVTATFQNTGAQFYYSSYLPAGARIIHNTIHDNVTNINRPGQGDLAARAVFQGQAIYIGQNRNNPGVGDQIENNTIIGSPQGGVYSDNQHTVVSGNDISMNATYSNDFCEAMAADYQVAENNNCHPVSGRGFHVNANYNVVSNNIIKVTELKQNAEYGGCELGGTYGVQVEFDDSFLPAPPVGVQVTGNTITANAGDCNAIGLRVTSMTPAGSVTFTGNTVTTNNAGGKGQDFGASLDSENSSGVTFTGNTFRSVFAYADGEWDGYSNNTFGHNTWLGTPQYTFVAVDGACASGQNGDHPVCPSNATFTDPLPNTVFCGPYSGATVTIGSHVTQCNKP